MYFSLISPPLLDENNWNPIEWERAAEELTWERVSLITIALFLENVTVYLLYIKCVLYAGS